MKDAESIRNEVDDFYRNVEAGKVNVAVSADRLYDSLGYDKALTAQLPEEVQLGLSCGNPLESLYIEDGESLLDLGCGVGMDVFMARLKFPHAGTIYGLDKLPEMLARAEKVLQKKGFKNIVFKQGTLTEMPFPDNAINKVISNCVINLEPDKQTVYRELHRILSPRGMFFISDITLKQPLSAELQRAENLYGT